MIRSLVVLIAFSLLTLSTITNSSADDHVPPRIKIGVIAPLSGNFAAYGKLIRDGVVAGGSNKVEFVFEDEECLPAKAVAALQRLVSVEKVSIVIGPCCGSPQEAVIPIIRSHPMVAMFPTSASQSLFKLSEFKAFSSQYSIEAESEFNAHEVFHRGLARIVILASANDFSRAHELAFRRSFKGEVIESIILPAVDGRAISATLPRIKRLAPDALYVPDASPFIYGLRTQLFAQGLKSLPVFSVYSAQSEDVLKAEGASANGLRYSYPAIKERDALSYFPRVAGEILSEAAIACAGEAVCVQEHLVTSGKFDQNGALRMPIEMREIRNGSFRTGTE